MQIKDDKDQLIKFLSKCLIGNDIIVRRGTADANTVIVERPLNYSKYSKTVVCCDILVILVSCYRRILHDMYFNTECKVNVSEGKQSRYCNIQEIVAANIDIKDCLLFGHAWAGCDTTSAIFQKGKFINKYS